MPKSEQTKNLLPSPSLDSSVEASLQTPFFSTGDWPEENWWEVFNSPQLNGLIAQALEKNPTLKEVQSKIDFAKQEAIVARSRLFPFMSFNGDIVKTYLSETGLYRAFNPKIPLNAQVIYLSLSLEYEFDFWGKNYNLFSASIGEVLANQAQAVQVRLIVTTAIAQAYFGLKANLQRRQLYQDLYNAQQATFDLQRFLEEKALSSRLDPLLLQEDVFEIKKLLSSIDNEIIVSKHLINFLLGRGPDEPLDVDSLMPPLPPTISVPDNITLDLLARRPDLMAQIWRAKALAYRVGAAKADFYPDVNLKGFVGLESVFLTNFFQWENRTYQIQPAFHLPIFTAGAIEANVEANKSAFDEAIFEYNNLVLSSAQEVADLLSLALSIFEQKLEQDFIVENAKARYWLTKMRKQAGLDSRFDELHVEIELVNKQIENVNLLYSQYLATIKLIKALGGGYYSDYCIPLQTVGECE
jgi:NodT family efflux transporter outer membrane factor (OMF) lipoprotein